MTAHTARLDRARAGGVYPPDVIVGRHARLSSDRTYRYALWRDWRANHQPPQWATFVMLNPSTADAEIDDRTIGRCVGFARAMDCTGLAVVNLYAYRATKPADLWRAEDPIGPDNDRTLRSFLDLSATYGGPLVAAWGANARPERVAEVMAMPGAERFTVLGTTKSGAPRHPLYLPADTQLEPLGGAS